MALLYGESTRKHNLQPYSIPAMKPEHTGNLVAVLALVVSALALIVSG